MHRQTPNTINFHLIWTGNGWKWPQPQRQNHYGNPEPAAMARHNATLIRTGSFWCVCFYSVIEELNQLLWLSNHPVQSYSVQFVSRCCCFAFCRSTRADPIRLGFEQSIGSKRPKRPQRPNIWTSVLAEMSLGLLGYMVFAMYECMTFASYAHKRG